MTHLNHLIEKKPATAEYLKILDPVSINNLCDKEMIGSSVNKQLPL